MSSDARAQGSREERTKTMTAQRIKTYAELIAIPDVLPVKWHPNTWYCLPCRSEFRSRRVQPACPTCGKSGAK